MKDQNTIHFLRAESGDCILIQMEDKNCILIDGGYKSTYQSELKPLLIQLSEHGYRISLFIVTHFDGDHIGGAITFIEENGDSDNPNIIPVDNIWFNGIFQLIMSDENIQSHLVEKISDSKNKKLQILHNQLTALIGAGTGYISATQARDFETLCLENHYQMNYGAIDGRIVNGSMLKFGNCVVKCLNPDHGQLELLTRWIDRKCIEHLGDKYELEKSDFLLFIQKLLIFTGKDNSNCSGVWEIASNYPNIDDWLNTSTLAPMNTVNRSSIVVEIKYGKCKMLFMGDSESNDWIVNADTFYDFVKLSHHGSSKPNVELFKQVKIKSALISTNGIKHRHPEDDLLARLIKSGVEDIYFNYNIRRKSDLLKIQDQYSFHAHFDETKIHF